MRGLCTLMVLCTLVFAEVNPQLATLISEISGDSIWKNVDTLTKFERYTDEGDAIFCTEFLKSLLEGYNYETVETQTYQNNYIPNVYAVKKGVTYPDQYHVIGAHYDSYTPGAAGADDNASGSGTLMEIARVLREYSFEKSVVLVFFSGEEIGLLGSEHFSDSAVRNSVDIETMINLDVIGYLKPGTDLEFDCSYNTPSKYLYDTLKSMMSDYLPHVGVVDASKKTFYRSSDHASFWNNNFNAVFFAEELNRYSNEFNGMWHTDKDQLGTSCNSRELMTAISQSTLLLTATNAGLVKKEAIESEKINNLTPIISALSLNSSALSFETSVAGDATVKLIKADGRVVKAMNHNLHSGTNNISFNNLLSSGVYLLQVSTSSQSITERVIVQ